MTRSADEDEYAFGAEVGGRSRFVVEYNSEDEYEGKSVKPF